MNNRRDFLKLSGFASLGLAGGSALSAYAAESVSGTPRVQRFNMSGFAAPKIEKVRLGIIGLGHRGPSHLATMRLLEGVEIRALCDVRPERVGMANSRLEGTIHKPTLYSGSPDAWRKLCEQDDLDLVIVTTPYYMHADMSVYAMEQGKHVATEVPAAATLEECWKLVETAERTRKHCQMLQNTAYNFFQVLTLNMARRGFFGEVVHGDCAYNTSKMANNFSKTMYWDMWWLKLYGSKKRQYLSHPRTRPRGSDHEHQPRRPLRLPRVDGQQRLHDARRRPRNWRPRMTSSSRSSIRRTAAT